MVRTGADRLISGADGLITGEDGLITGGDGLITGEDGLITGEDGPITGEDGLISADDGLISADDGLISADDGPIFADDGLIFADDGLIFEPRRIQTCPRRRATYNPRILMEPFAALRSLLLALTALVAFVSATLADDFLPGVKRVLFLGDSITYAGHYTELFDAFLFTQFPDRRIEVIDCGLPSETCSGLSEAGHAGGKFPRPDVHERLDRVLATVKPDLVFACYGMNCGIYLPLDDARFAAYQAGQRKLHEKVEKSGAKIIHLTPPVFDALPLKDRVKPAATVKDGEFFEGYNGVLDRYSAWLVEQGKKEGWHVIDTHKAMWIALLFNRKNDPSFSYAKDGVHANNDGHRVIASAILHDLAPEAQWMKFEALLNGDWAKSAQGRAFFDDIHKRNRLLCDSYLSTAGHLRPGMAKGLPVAEAEEKAAAFEAKIRDAAKSAK